MDRKHFIRKAESTKSCEDCDYTSERSSNVERHKKIHEKKEKVNESTRTKYRKLKKLKDELDIKEKVEETKVFNEEDVLKLMEDYNGSFNLIG